MTVSKRIDFLTAKRMVEGWVEENGANYGVTASDNRVEAHRLVTQAKCDQYVQEMMKGESADAPCPDCLGVFLDSSKVFYMDADGDSREDVIVQAETDMCQPHNGFSDTEPFIFLLQNRGADTPKIAKLAVTVTENDIFERDHDATLRREYSHVQFVKAEHNEVIGVIRYKSVDACMACPWDLEYDIAFKVSGNVLASQRVVKVEKNPQGTWAGTISNSAGNSEGIATTNTSQPATSQSANQTTPTSQIDMQLLSFDNRNRQLYAAWNKEESDLQRRNGSPREFLGCYNRYYVQFGSLLGELNTFEEHAQISGSQRTSLAALHSQIDNAINLLTQKKNLEKGTSDFEQSLR